MLYSALLMYLPCWNVPHVAMLPFVVQSMNKAGIQSAFKIDQGSAPPHCTARVNCLLCPWCKECAAIPYSSFPQA